MSLLTRLPRGPVRSRVPARRLRKQLSAAQDFEALLIGQMLRSIRDEGSCWLGTGDDDAGATAVGFGEEQLAKALTKGGGLGLSKVIASGLAVKSAAAVKHAEQSASVDLRR